VILTVVYAPGYGIRDRHVEDPKLAAGSKIPNLSGACPVIASTLRSRQLRRTGCGGRVSDGGWCREGEVRFSPLIYWMDTYLQLQYFGTDLKERSFVIGSKS